jgi:large subunit ribosomal protein L22
MYLYTYKIVYKDKEGNENFELIKTKDIKEAKRIAHEKFWNNKWQSFKISPFTFNGFTRYLRTSYKKLKPILDLIRGKDLDEAINIVAFIPRKAARMVEKLLLSVKANAEYLSDKYKDVDINNLFVYEVFVNKGPYIKRWDTKARGSGTRILKHTSHITLKVSERTKIKKKKVKESKESKEVKVSK